MNRRFFLTTAPIALARATNLIASPVHASDEWCVIDPKLLIATRRGTVDVHITLWGRGPEHQAALTAARISHIAVPGKDQTIKVEVFVLIPRDGRTSFPTRCVISSEENGGGAVCSG